MKHNNQLYVTNSIMKLIPTSTMIIGVVTLKIVKIIVVFDLKRFSSLLSKGIML